MSKYNILHYKAVAKTANFAVGDITRFVITNCELERAVKLEEAKVDRGTYIVAEFPVGALDKETQEQNTLQLCAYLNKVHEAKERAAAAVSMGFLSS